MSVTGVWMRVDLSGAAPVFTVRWYTDGHGCFSGPYWETSSATDMTLADFDCVENPDFPEFSSFAVHSGTFTTTYLPDWYNARFLVGGGGVPRRGLPLVRGLDVSDDEPPTLPEQAVSAAKAAATFAASGFARVDRAEFERRRSICAACEHFDAAKVKCRRCGCLLRYKPWLATAHCPLIPPKW